MDRINRVISALHANRISSKYLPSRNDLKEELQAFLRNGIVAGAGDSVTLAELGVYEFLRAQDVVFLDKYKENLSPEEKREIYLKNFSADVFFAGINALTETGKIFNMDGNGSRVAPVIYGPEKVILICGTNKIVATDEEAVARIKNTAAPLDAGRLGKKTPCAEAGRCVDCASPEKICNYFTVIQGQFNPDRINVFIVEGRYGF